MFQFCAIYRSLSLSLSLSLSYQPLLLWTWGKLFINRS